MVSSRTVLVCIALFLAMVMTISSAPVDDNELETTDNEKLHIGGKSVTDGSTTSGNKKRPTINKPKTPASKTESLTIEKTTPLSEEHSQTNEHTTPVSEEKTETNEHTTPVSEETTGTTERTKTSIKDTTTPITETNERTKTPVDDKTTPSGETKETTAPLEVVTSKLLFADLQVLPDIGDDTKNTSLLFKTDNDIPVTPSTEGPRSFQVTLPDDNVPEKNKSL